MAKSDRRPKSTAARPVMAMPRWLLARVSIGNAQASYMHGQRRELQALRSAFPVSNGNRRKQGKTLGKKKQMFFLVH
jgi:hypothetical protein